MSQSATYTPAERALAALWFPLNQEDETINEWLERWLPAHIDDIRRLLEVDHVRLGTDNLADPMMFAIIRTKRPYGFQAKDVIESLPGSYIAPAFRGFSYTNTGFRDWHVTSHSDSDNLDRLAGLATGLISEGVMDWFYGVDAHGQHNHMHAILTFRHPHTQDWVKNTFHLSEGAKLSPVHGDFGWAKAYLDNQATRTIERGVRPNRPIFIDGNNTEIKKKNLALEAISTGENTSVLKKLPEDRLVEKEKQAIEMWMEKAAAEPRVEHRTRVQTVREANELAKSLAKGYSGKVFKANFKAMIPGSMFKRYPSGWYGHEVVELLNVPPNVIDDQLQARWIKSVPEVVYTIDENPIPSAVEYVGPVNPFRRPNRPPQPQQRQLNMQDLGIEQPQETQPNQAEPSRNWPPLRPVGPRTFEPAQNESGLYSQWYDYLNIPRGGYRVPSTPNNG